jgi:hypothetical protein
MRGFVGHIGQGGQAGRSRLRSTTKRREAAQAEGAEASGLERAARAGVIPTLCKAALLRIAGKET